MCMSMYAVGEGKRGGAIHAKQGQAFGRNISQSTVTHIKNTDHPHTSKTHIIHTHQKHISSTHIFRNIYRSG